MENILILDPGFGSLNKGDEIISECVHKELYFLTKDKFVLELSTQLASFDITQVMRNMARVNYYSTCRLKFVAGSNLALMNMRHHYPQWNVNILNYKPYKGCIFVGVGVGEDEKSNRYTTNLYKKMLNHDYYHSVRDERSKRYIESLGLKAINTGCATMWMLTPDFCKTIPTKKAPNVVFTLNEYENDSREQQFIDILKSHYEHLYFWPQGVNDYEYLHRYKNIEDITIVPATKDAYDEILKREDIEYVGTRLHAGIYAMRHAKRSIIIIIDERARDINESNNLNCIEKNKLEDLGQMIESEFETNIIMPFDEIKRWKAQFNL